MNYQKTYMNHIHSSSLLCQLATMWKSQTLCDAIIRTGSITTKAHRVVLVAACPMLQSMENAAAGSHLEVRLAADIKQDSINSFLQYLYEGFITLTEENCKDVEKIARLLQVENVIKCCADFHKCLNTSAGSQYKYTFSDQLEFRHMRTTDLSKVQERMSKRHMDSFRPSSPGAKRQRIIRPSSPPTDVSMHGASQKVHDTASMAESYMTGAPDPMDRVPRLGSGMHQSLGSSSHPSPSRQAASSQPGVVNIVEDSIELIQTEPPGKHPGEGHSQETRKVQSSVSISVASQHNAKTDLQIVNVTGSESASTSKTSSSSDALPITIPGSPSSSSSSSFKESSNVSHVQERHTSTSQQNSLQQKTDSEKTSINLTDVPFTSESELMSGVRPRGPEPFSTSTPQRIPFPVSLSAVQRAPSQPYQSKQIPSYAAGSASQAESMTPPGGAGRGQRSQSLGSTGRSENVERGSPVSTQVKDTSVKTKPESSVDMTPDISIVKVEGGGNDPSLDYTGGLDMFVSEAGVTSQPRAGDDDDPNVSDFELEEPPGDMSRDEQMSNEGSNIGGDQSGNWYMGAFRGQTTEISPVHTNMDNLGLNPLLEASGQYNLNKGHVPGHVIHDLLLDGNSLVNLSNFPDEKNKHMDRKRSSAVDKSHDIVKCAQCSESIYRADLLNHIEKRHSDSNLHVLKCTFCGKNFRSKWGLHVHNQMYHSSEKNFPKCKICAKTFPSETHLATHLISHSGQRNFRCSVCQKAYKLKHHLKAHVCRPGVSSLSNTM